MGFPFETHSIGAERFKGGNNGPKRPQNLRISSGDTKNRLSSTSIIKRIVTIEIIEIDEAYLDKVIQNRKF